MIHLRRDGDVFVLTMQAGENRFNRPFLDARNEALDTVEASPGPAVLVATGGQGKFYAKDSSDAISLATGSLIRPCRTVPRITGMNNARGTLYHPARRFMSPLL